MRIIFCCIYSFNLLIFNQYEYLWLRREVIFPLISVEYLRCWLMKQLFNVSSCNMSSPRRCAPRKVTAHITALRSYCIIYELGFSCILLFLFLFFFIACSKFGTEPYKCRLTLLYKGLGVEVDENVFRNKVKADDLLHLKVRGK